MLCFQPNIESVPLRNESRENSKTSGVNSQGSRRRSVCRKRKHTRSRSTQRRETSIVVKRRRQLHKKDDNDRSEDVLLLKRPRRNVSRKSEHKCQCRCQCHRESGKESQSSGAGSFSDHGSRSGRNNEVTVQYSDHGAISNRNNGVMVQYSDEGAASNSDNVVTVATVQYSADGKRLRNKKLVCFVCRAEVLWLSRHFEKQHNDNVLVSQVLSATGHRRKDGLRRLKNLGNFKHNVDVLKNCSGQLRVIRRPKGSYDVDQYLPCPVCYGFYHQHELWRHVCPCDTPPTDDNNQNTGKANDNARALLQGATGNPERVDENLTQNVISNMRGDKLLRIIKSDKLIRQLGVAQLKQLGVKRSRQIAVRMRVLARLVHHLQTAMKNSWSLSQFLCGTHYDTVVEAVERLAGLHVDESGNRVFARPSVMLSIGNLLPKCCQIKKGVAIAEDDEVAVGEVDGFLSLFKSNWTKSMSSVCLSMPKDKAYSEAVEFPSTSDIMKLKSYTEDERNDVECDNTDDDNFSKEIRRLVSFMKCICVHG